jgi:hypothetical protein
VVSQLSGTPNEGLAVTESLILEDNGHRRSRVARAPPAHRTAHAGTGFRCGRARVVPGHSRPDALLRWS